MVFKFLAFFVLIEVRNFDAKTQLICIKLCQSLYSEICFLMHYIKVGFKNISVQKESFDGNSVVKMTVMLIVGVECVSCFSICIKL